MPTKRTLKPRREVVTDPDGHPILSDAERLRQAAPPPAAETPAAPLASILIYAATADSPPSWQINGYNAYGAITVLGIVRDRLQADLLAAMIAGEKKEPTDG